jgi:serine/threonine protein kinase
MNDRLERTAPATGGSKGDGMSIDTQTTKLLHSVENVVQHDRTLQGWRVEKLLGEGGMGTTYLLRIASGANQVLKMIKYSYAANEDARTLFIREMKLTRELAHRNIIALLDSGEHEGQLFYTMEYCDGGSADHLVNSPREKLQPELAVAIMMDVLAGLAFAHAAPVTDVVLRDGSRAAGEGIVHRDLKPQNILLMRNGPAKVADLGLAKAFQFAGLSGVTPPGAPGGTIAFQPRQQVNDYLCAKPEVDIWAAAASLYYLLTGALTRDFVGRVSAAETVLTTCPIPIRQRDSDVPRDLAEVIDRALDDTGGALPYQNANDLRDALRPWAGAGTA